MECLLIRPFGDIAAEARQASLSGDCRSICRATLVAFEAAEIGADRSLVGVRWHEDNVVDRIVRTIRGPAAVQMGGKN